MIFFLILGAALGAVSIIFVLQNITPVTVTFFTFQLSASLALVLFLALLSGVVMTILILLPGFVRDEFRVSRLKKQNRELEDELMHSKETLNTLSARTKVVETPDGVSDGTVSL